MTSYTTSPTVLVAAKPTLYRTGLVALLKQQWPELALTLTADSGQVIDLIRTQFFQLLILDDHLPGRTLPSLLHCLRQARPTQKIVLLTADNQPLSTVISSQLSVPQNITPSQLAAMLDPLLKATPCQNISPRTFRSTLTHFSPREFEVLRLVADDRCNQEIADQLYLSVRTIESHRRALLQKSGTRTLAGLVAWALRMGMVA